MTQSITLDNLELTRFFFAIVSLLAAAHFFGYLFHRFKLPRVIGEIFGGALLGPSCLGYFYPQAMDWLFNAFEGEGKLLSMIYWFGLVLLMFISGFEIQKTITRQDRRLVSAILLGATIVPFLAGWFAPVFYDFTPYLGVKQNQTALRLVIAIAVAVTSIPVISKIFIDLNITQTRFAKIVLSTATIQDVILWVALAIATGLVSTESPSIGNMAGTVVVTVLFFAVSLLCIPYVLAYTNTLRLNLVLKSSVAGYVLVICLLFTALASLLNVNIVFGSFLAGIVVGTMPRERFANVQNSIREFALAFFVPIYFAIVGLKLDLIQHFQPMFFFGFLLFTTIFESLGTLLAARFMRLDWLSSFNLSVAMNTRGGPGIILATVAFDLGIISQTFFVTLVLIAIVTSLLAGAWFKFLLSKNWPLLSD